MSLIVIGVGNAAERGHTVVVRLDLMGNLVSGVMQRGHAWY